MRFSIRPARLILSKARGRSIVGLSLMLIECGACLPRLGGDSCFGCTAGQDSIRGVALG
jgi:hypothetical protein